MDACKAIFIESPLTTKLNSIFDHFSVHLGVEKPKRIIASSAQACPGRTFWLIQADDGYTILFKLDFFRLPCSNQYLKIRNGDDLQSDLIGEYIGGMENKLELLESSGSELLIEFKSEGLSHMDHGLCGGGFLAHATQKGKPLNTNQITKCVWSLENINHSSLLQYLKIINIIEN